MKRRRNLLIAIGVLAVVCVAIFAEKKIQKHVDDIQTVDEVVMEVDPSAVTEASWTYGDTDLDFVKEDDTWEDADDEAFPVDQDKMEDMLEAFTEVHASYVIDDVEDYDQYGLKDPQATLTFTEDGEEKTVTFGNFSTMDSKRYISVGDGRVFLIDEDLLEDVTQDRDDLMQKDELTNYDLLDSLTLSGEDALEITREPDAHYSYTDLFDYYLIQDQDHLPLSKTNIDTLMTNLTGLDLSSYTTYELTDEELSKYGLDNPALTVVVSGKYVPEDEDADETDSTSASSSSAEEADESEMESGSYTMYFGKIDGDDDNVYLRVNDSKIVYIIPSDSYDTIVSADYDSLRPTKVITMNWSDCESIDLSLDGTDTEIVFGHKGDTDTYTIGDEDVDMDTVLDKIDAMVVNTFTDEEPDKTLEFSMTVNTAASDDRDARSISLEFYQYDGDNVLVVFDGETLGLVDRTDVVNLEEAFQDVILNLGKTETDSSSAE